MHVSNSPEILKKLLGNRPVRLALGNFDGIHLGHRQLIKDVVSQTQLNNESSVVVTFSPHPAQFFGRNHGFKKLDTPRIQREILEELGVSGLLELPFNEQIAGMTGHDFIKQVLGVLPLREVIVGEDFRFGRDRLGGLETLKKFGREQGFSVSALQMVELDGAPVSSSRVRHLIAQDGDVSLAKNLLGRPYCLEGVIADGQKIGRSIGFPTANLEGVDQVVPKVGVYSGTLSILTEAGRSNEAHLNLPCVINIGIRPTVSDESRVTIEAHVYGPSGENLHLYHKMIHLKFIRRLRDERRFASVEELKDQIFKDIESAQK